MTELVEKFQEVHQGIVEALKTTRHHHVGVDGTVTTNPYHLEDDCWSHTMLVVRNALDEDLVGPLDKRLVLATLLHDIGKINTRRNSDKNPGRIHFYGHAGVSFWRAVAILNGPMGEGFSEADKRLVLETISLHHNYMDKLTGGIECVGGDFSGNPSLREMVLDHSKCDALGRIFKEGYHDTSRQDIRNTVWTDSASEFRHKEGRPVVTLLVGPPASGKSTIANRIPSVLSRDALVNEYGIGDTYTERFNSVDQKLVDKKFNEALRTFYADGIGFTIDKCHVSPKSRRQALASAPREYW